MSVNFRTILSTTFDPNMTKTCMNPYSEGGLWACFEYLRLPLRGWELTLFHSIQCFRLIAEMKKADSQWLVVVEPDSAIDLATLSIYLSKFNSAEPSYHGYALKDQRCRLALNFLISIRRL